MIKIFYVGFFFYVASTIAFIVAILTPYWIVKSDPDYRGIFEVCDKDDTYGDLRQCGYILTYSNTPYIGLYRTDYAIACASLSIAASSLAIIFLWISGIEMCVESKTAKLRCAEILIAGTLLITSLIVVVWVVMLAKNLDQSNVITTSQIGWSLWLAVGSTGGFLIALVLFCVHRIDTGISRSKRSTYNESREYLQRF